MARENLRRSSFECSDRIPGMDRSRAAGSVQTTTPTHHAMTITNSASPNHSHDVAYGSGPMTNRETSSDTDVYPRARGGGEQLCHRGEPRADLSAAADDRVGDRAGRHELLEVALSLVLGP